MKEPKPEGVQHYHTLLFCTYSWMTQQLGYTRLPQDLRQVNATEPLWVSCLAYQRKLHLVGQGQVGVTK